MTFRMVLVGSVLCLGSFSAPLGAWGQSVEGRVLDATSDRPIGGAIVRLIDSSGESVAATAADSVGRYRLDVTEAGRYRLRAEQLAYEPYLSRQLEVGGSAALSIDLPMRPAPIGIRGVEVSADRLDRRIREQTGLSTGRLRIAPIRYPTIREYAARGNGLSEMIRSQQIPGLEVLRTAGGPCYQFRGRRCAPVYVDGARLTRSSPTGLPLEWMGAVVVLRPNESVAYPEGAVLVYTLGFIG